MKPFSYTRPESVSQAVALLSDETRPLAGGTDLLPLLKGDVVDLTQLVDVKRLPELESGITHEYVDLKIGALTTLSEIASDPLVQQHLPALAEAARLAATPQLRNMATIGGNLLQRPRCWYFRNHLVPCWLKGGTECYARNGENRFHAVIDQSPCVAVHPSDLATALMAYGAEVHIVDRQGRGAMAIEDLLQPPTDENRREHVLPKDAVITHLMVPVPSDTVASTYLKAMDRKVWAFAVVGVAVALELQGETVSDARIVLGGVSNVPVRATEAEHALLGQAVTDDSAGAAADAAIAAMTPLSGNAYKVDVARELVRRAIVTLSGGDAE